MVKFLKKKREVNLNIIKNYRGVLQHCQLIQVIKIKETILQNLAIL